MSTCDARRIFLLKNLTLFQRQVSFCTFTKITQLFLAFVWISINKKERQGGGEKRGKSWNISPRLIKGKMRREEKKMRNYYR